MSVFLLFLGKIFQQLNLEWYQQKLLAGPLKENSKIFYEHFYLPLYLPLWAKESTTKWRCMCSMSSLIVHTKKLITARTQLWKVDRVSAELEVRFEASRDDLLRDESYVSRLTCTRRSHADLRLLTSSRGRKSSMMRIPSVLTNILFIPQHLLFVSTIYSYVAQRGSDVGF